MCGTLHSMLPHAPAKRKLAGLAGSMKAYTVQAHISWHLKDLCRDFDGETDVAVRSCRAPGTSFVFSAPYLLLPSLQIEFVRWFRSTGIPMGYAQVVL